MVSRCQRYVIVYNGEVYNAAELRQELEAERSQLHADRQSLSNCDCAALDSLMDSVDAIAAATADDIGGWSEQT